MNKTPVQEEIRRVSPELLFSRVAGDPDNRENYKKAIELIYEERGEEVPPHLRVQLKPEPELELQVLPEQPVSVTEIGEMLKAEWGLSKPIAAKEVNQLLIDLNLQERERKPGGKAYWKLTEAGQHFATVIKVEIAGSTSQITQVKWFPKLLTAFIVEKNLKFKS